ncbi:Putative protein of unknown function [Podospora comata]|uniref:Uncharacterized protein n=1 Tax=Podospora comata TaxID=48703 RepID=A0ABY6RTM5_PODCO|nr:Putative protein of unknown function [Podospora comata]
MGGGNGAKAAQKRARNAKDAAPKAASQLKSNEKAMSIICNICKQTFLSTSRKPQLEQHSSSGKHAGKHTFEQCFPEYKE